MTAKDFLDTNDFTKDQLLDMIELSRVLKRCVKAGYFPELLRHKALGMIFQQVSTRTRLSFEVGHRARHHPAGRPRDHRGLRARDGAPPGRHHGTRRSS